MAECRITKTGISVTLILDGTEAEAVHSAVQRLVRDRQLDTYRPNPTSINEGYLKVYQALNPLIKEIRGY